jgi:hypothetical protein
MTIAAARLTIHLLGTPEIQIVRFSDAFPVYFSLVLG